MVEPFPTSLPVIGENLIGREKEVSNIYEMVSQGQSVILIGPRRIGKTSIMLEVLDRLRKAGFFTGKIDLFNVVSKRELAEKIVDSTLENAKIKHFIKQIKENLSEALKQIEIKQTIADFEYTISLLDTKKDEWQILDINMDFPEEFAKKKGNRCVFAYDEFADLAKLNGEVLMKKMRAHFQLHRHVAYIFSGSQESLMKELFQGSKSAFFRFGIIFYVDRLPQEPTRDYISQAFARLKITITEDLIMEILRLTDCHPFYTQLLCKFLYFTMIKESRKNISLKHISDAHYQAVAGEWAYFEDLWEKLPDQESCLLLRNIALAHEIERNEQTDKALSRLDRYGYVRFEKPGKYRMIDPFFKEYIRLKHEGLI